MAAEAAVGRQQIEEGEEGEEGRGRQGKGGNEGGKRDSGVDFGASSPSDQEASKKQKVWGIKYLTPQIGKTNKPLHVVRRKAQAHEIPHA
ncbi:hypothetical protein HJFPF1_03331 [Paramyrothecium foliicola]|nr:hypothetical protein HJFPF1_03331 [Paramyrothecium foliicola]